MATPDMSVSQPESRPTSFVGHTHLGLGVLMEADDTATFATADGIAVGTVDYMSPEQACGRDVDGRSDLFSLGCAMYHLMTGRLPFPGDSQIDRLGRRISGRRVPLTDVMPDAPAGLVQVMDKLLAHKPEDRFQGADEAAEALQALIRPRSKSASAITRMPAPAEAPAAPAREPPSTTDQILRLHPVYPAWFRPLALLAARRPLSALPTVLGTLGAAFGGGFGLAWLFR